jgi:hypothetical protein
VYDFIAGLLVFATIVVSCSAVASVDHIKESSSNLQNEQINKQIHNLRISDYGQ